MWVAEQYKHRSEPCLPGVRRIVELPIIVLSVFLVKGRPPDHLHQATPAHLDPILNFQLIQFSRGIDPSDVDRPNRAMRVSCTSPGTAQLAQSVAQVEQSSCAAMMTAIVADNCCFEFASHAAIITG
jgi:hypothetical protein